MRTVITLFAVVILLLGVWWGLRADPPLRPVVEPAVSSPAPAPKVPPGTTPVSGFVFDAADGRPVEGALLRGCTESGASVTGRTDARGRYVLYLPEGERKVTEVDVRAAGYFEEDGRSNEVTLAGRVHTFFLERILREIPGRVVDHQGCPVAGASIISGDEDHWTSDAQGWFGPLPVGRCDFPFLAWSDHHALTEGQCYPIDGSWPEALVIRLDPTAATRILVVDGEGRPVPGAMVRREWEGLPQRLRTGADGTVDFPLRPYEEELLIASEGNRLGGVHARGGGSARIVIRSRDDPEFRPPREVHMAPSPPPDPNAPEVPAPSPHPPPPPPAPPVLRLVEFQVTTPDGRSLPGAEFSVRFRQHLGGMSFRLWMAYEITDQEGRCSLEVPVGEPLRISGEWGDLFAGRRELVLPVRRDPGPVVLVLDAREPADFGPGPQPEPAPNPVRVRVLDAAGLPVPDAKVTGLSGGRELTDADGIAVLAADDPESSFRFYVGVFGNPELWGTALPGGPPVVVRLPPRGSIRIRLNRSYLDSRERPEFEIYETELQRQVFLTQETRGFTSDEGDSVRIDCPAGTWPFFFGVWPGEEVFYGPVTVRAGEETLLSYDFPSLSTAELRIVDREGRPVPRARIVVAETMLGAWEADKQGLVDASDGFWSGPLPLRPGHLLVSARGFAPTVVGPLNFWAPLGLDIRLGAGAKVRGRLVDAAGEPIYGDVGWQPAGGPLFAETNSTEIDGTFELPSLLPEGRQTLVVLIEGREPVKQVVLVPRTGEVEVTIVIP